MMGAISRYNPAAMADDTAVTELKLDTLMQALAGSQLSLMRNQGTGMGTALDPFTQVEIGYGRLLSEFQLRSLFRGSWFIRRVVEVPADDMTKAGVTLTLHDDTSGDHSTAALQVYMDGGQNVSPYSTRMSCGEAFRKAMTWGRWFGQAYAVLRVNGGEDPSKPLRKVKSFEGLSVLDRYAMRPDVGTLHPEHPEFYRIDRLDDTKGPSQTYKMGQRIHESRVLVFRGAAIHPHDIQLEGDGSYDSVIQQVYEVFTRHYMAKDAISKGLDSYSLLKVAIGGLANLLSGEGGTDTLRAYLNTVAQQISLHRIFVQDTEASKSEFQERTFAGVEGLFAQMAEELTAAANLPHYKIWGSVGKAGLSDSGGAESRAWAEQVQAMQQREFGDNHRRLFYAIFESLGTVPESWEVEYPSIYTPTPEEEGAIAKTQAETLTLLTREGVITTRQAYQALATGQPLENVLEPLDDSDVLTIVDEAESEGPSAEEELAALLGGGGVTATEPPAVDEPAAVPVDEPEEDPDDRDDAADWREDKGRGKRCGRGWISPSKKCGGKPGTDAGDDELVDSVSRSKSVAQLPGVRDLMAQVSSIRKFASEINNSPALAEFRQAYKDTERETIRQLRETVHRGIAAESQFSKLQDSKKWRGVRDVARLSGVDSKAIIARLDEFADSESDSLVINGANKSRWLLTSESQGFNTKFVRIPLDWNPDLGEWDATAWRVRNSNPDYTLPEVDRTDAADTYTPPASARNNAQQVLDWREEHGDDVKGMTEVGWGRARQLASGDPISLDTVKRIAQFNRHRQNYEKARAKQKAEGGNPWEYAGVVMWLGWGGSSSISWAKGISDRADSADVSTDETLDAATFTDKALHSQAIAWAKKTYSIWPSAYASGAMTRRYKELYKAKHGTTEGAIKGDWLDIDLPGLIHIDDLDADELRGDNLEQWFNESWVRISSSGEILGECGGREEGEGKPKCLPRARAEGMTKSARAAAVRRKREADPDPEREGQARNVATDASDTDPADLVLLAVKAIYEQSNWTVIGIRNLQIFEGGLSVEVAVENSDTGDRVLVQGQYDDATGVYNDRLLAESKADSTWRMDAPRKKSAGGGSAPQCKKGRPCGRSCIAANRNCKVNTQGVVNQALSQAVSSGAGSSGGGGQPVAPPQLTPVQAIRAALASGDISEAVRQSNQIYLDAQKLAPDRSTFYQGIAAGNATPDDWILKRLNQITGYDGKPQQVTKGAIDAAYNNGQHVAYRAMSSTPASFNKRFDDFKNGDFYAGHGVYGHGTYVAYAVQGGMWGKGVAHKAASPYGSGMMRLALAPNANVVKADDLQREVRGVDVALKNWYRQSGDKEGYRRARAVLIGDSGEDVSARLATIKGYDAITLTGVAYNDTYMTLLNRSKTIVQKTKGSKTQP